MTPFVPEGPERQVRHLGSASVGGASVATIIVLSAVVTTLAFIPFSVVLSTGGSMPMSQGVFPLVGWLLGPVAGSAACAIGSLVGVFMAPHTAGIAVLSVGGAAVAALSAGAMAHRAALRLGLVVVFAVALAWYAASAALSHGVRPAVVVAGTFIDWSGILLFVLPTRRLCVRWIGAAQLSRVAAGLFLGTWMISGVTHVCQAAISYSLFHWPEQVWITLIPIIPFENLARSFIGAVIGTGVISGLRAIGLLRPREAIY